MTLPACFAPCGGIENRLVRVLSGYQFGKKNLSAASAVKHLASKQYVTPMVVKIGFLPCPYLLQLDRDSLGPTGEDGRQGALSASFGFAFHELPLGGTGVMEMIENAEVSVFFISKMNNGTVLRVEASSGTFDLKQSEISSGESNVLVDVDVEHVEWVDQHPKRKLCVLWFVFGEPRVTDRGHGLEILDHSDELPGVFFLSVVSGDIREIEIEDTLFHQSLRVLIEDDAIIVRATASGTTLSKPSSTSA